MPIAVIEAKDNSHSVGAGMQQALAGAEALDVPFAFSTNGDAFLEHDRTRREGVVEREVTLKHGFGSNRNPVQSCSRRRFAPERLTLCTRQSSFFVACCSENSTVHDY
jgi:type I restriction enzyme R subunit